VNSLVPSQTRTSLYGITLSLVVLHELITSKAMGGNMYCLFHTCRP